MKIRSDHESSGDRKILIKRCVKQVFHSLFLGALVIILFIPACTQSTKSSGDRLIDIGFIKAPEREEGYRMTEVELADDLMRFATGLSMTISQTTDEIKRSADTLQLRADMHRVKMRFIISAISIASGPEPEENLLDMVVFVTLARETVEDYWIPQVYGDQIEGLLVTTQELEDEIWSIAGKALTPEHQQELRELITEWRKQNPDQRYISHIRLSDFAALKRKSELMDAEKSGGLLPEVQDVTLAMDELTLSANKLTFTLQILPTVARWQAELAYYEMASQPEVESIKKETQKITDVSMRLASTLEDLPEWITNERKDLMSDMESNEKLLRGMLTEVRTVVTASNELASSIDKTVETTGFRMADFRESVKGISTAAQQLNAVVMSIDKLMISPGWDKRIPQLMETTGKVESMGERLVDHVFRMGLILIVIFLAGGVIAMLLYRYIAGRMFGSSSKG